MIAGIVAATLLGFAVALHGASPSAAALVTSERSASSPATPTSARPPSRPPSATPALNTRSPTAPASAAAPLAPRPGSAKNYLSPGYCAHTTPPGSRCQAQVEWHRAGNDWDALWCESAESQNQVLEPPSVYHTSNRSSAKHCTGDRTPKCGRLVEAAGEAPRAPCRLGRKLQHIASLCVPPAR